MPHFRHLFALKQGMRKNIGLSIALAIALCAVGGCDDSHHGKPAVKAETRKSAPSMLSAYTVGAGWEATADTKLSSWSFKQRADRFSPDSLTAIRAALEENMLPPRDSVRIAEIVNRLLPAEAVSEPAPSATGQRHSRIILVTTPWNEDTLLLWVELNGLDTAVRDTAGRAPVTIAFNPDAVVAFRPLGDPTSLPILDGEGPEAAMPSAAMLYELILQPGIIEKSAIRYAVLRIDDGKSGGNKAEWVITAADLIGNFDDAPEIVRFSAAVAGFGGLLRGDPAVRDLSCGDVIALAQSADRPDPDGRRAEIIRLMQRAEPLIELPSGDQSATEGAR